MFQVGEIVWHPKFKRGEVAQSAGTDLRVMFDDPQWNPRITTEPAKYISKETQKDVFKGNLASGKEEMNKELDEELKDSTLTPEEQAEYRRQRQAEKARAVVFEDESSRETAKKSALEGHTVHWDSENYQPPTLKGGAPDPRFSHPVRPGYFRVQKVIQPMGFFYNDAGEKVWHPKTDLVDLNLVDNKTGAKYLVEIDARYFPEISVAKKVPYEELSLLMDDDDSFGGFSQPKK